VIVGEILPSVHLSALDITLGVVALVAANLAIATWPGGACISRCCWRSTSP